MEEVNSYIGALLSHPLRLLHWSDGLCSVSDYLTFSSTKVLMRTRDRGDMHGHCRLGVLASTVDICANEKDKPYAHTRLDEASITVENATDSWKR